jgi:hypothetical protein
MPATYDCIATTTLGSTASSITFSSIPSTFTDLVIIFSGQNSTSSNADVTMVLNNDTSAAYSRMRLYSNGTTVSADRAINATSAEAVAYIGGSATSSMFASTQINILSYANTSVNKTWLLHWNSNGTSDAYSLMGIGLYRSLSAITQIQFYPVSGNFVAGTTATIYGIKAA